MKIGTFSLQINPCFYIELFALQYAVGGVSIVELSDESDFYFPLGIGSSWKELTPLASGMAYKQIAINKLVIYNI